VAKIKPVRHDDQLRLIDHLKERRSRIVYSRVFVAVAFAVCFWQSNPILAIAAAPLPAENKAKSVPAPTEAFMTTVTVCVYAALIVSAPFISYQLFAYVLPAFSPRERKAIMPLLITIPALFIVGCIFAYFVVVPAAIKFLLNFNDEQFAIQLRAREYYSFFSMTLLAGGAVFELPVVILALVRLRILSVQQLRKNRRYAYLICAMLAAALPGVDPISMLIETVPLLVLYELSILLARGIGQPKEGAESQIPSIQEN